MWTMGHNAKTVYDDRVFYELDTGVGQSGSPIWLEYKQSEQDARNTPMIVGVHTYGEGIWGTGNSGTRLTQLKVISIFNYVKENWITEDRIQLPPAEFGAIEYGDQYYLGQGVEQNLQRAYICYSNTPPTDSQETANASRRLGEMHHFGRGANLDGTKAVEYYEKAANQHANPNAYAWALRGLGDLYYFGAPGIQPDYVKALDYYLRAKNNPTRKQSCSRMGPPSASVKSITFNIRTTQNSREALNYFELRAADQADDKNVRTTSRKWLGILYAAGGEGVVKILEISRHCPRTSSQ